MFCTFSLRNVLRTTTVCSFSIFFDISTAKSGPTLRCFVHFHFENVLRATTACTFSTSKLSTSKSAPRPRCFVHFDLQTPQQRAIFIQHPLLQRAYFLTLQSPKSLEKRSVSRLSYLFSHLHFLSSYSFSSTLLSSDLSLLSASSLLCLSSVHIVGSLTSKLLSIIWYLYCVLC